MSTSGRRQRSRHLVITTRAASAFDRTHWESAAGSEEHITLAIQWIEHASGGRVQRPAGVAATR
jgi:hypothetical protein